MSEKPFRTPDSFDISHDREDISPAVERDTGRAHRINVIERPHTQQVAVRVGERALRVPQRTQ